jgi:hypothetical protein
LRKINLRKYNKNDMYKAVKLTNEIIDTTQVVSQYENIRLIQVEPDTPLKIVFEIGGSLDFKVNQTVKVRHKVISITKPPLVNCVMKIEVS